MKLKLLTVTLLLSFFGFSQDFKVSMFVSESDLKTNTFAKDSTASAVVIYDHGNSFIDKESFALRFQIKQKIKILKTQGIDRGVYEVKLYKGKSSKEKIKNIKGATYNLENGSMVKTELTSNAIFKEENEKYTLVKFVLPNVKVGSVITVSYETQSRFITKYQPWYFQGRDPVLYSEYNTSIPGNYEYNIKLVGKIPLDVNDAKIEGSCLEVSRGGYADCTVSKYVMKNIPAYKPEDFTTTSLNYLARIEYELSLIRSFDGTIDKLTKTWKDVDKELKTDKDFGRQISKKSLVKDVLPNSISGMDQNIDKAKAIYYYILNNYTWNGKSERYDVSVKNLINEKNGSVFEINLLLENLLSSEGFEVFPILMSTRGNGFATKIYPVLTDFNYVILKITEGQNDYFLDATENYLTFGELPFRCLNQYGRLINFDDVSYWEPIAASGYSTKTHRVQLNDFENDELYGTIESKFTNYHAHGLKQQFDDNPNSYLENKINTFSNLTIEDHKVLDFDKTKPNFNEAIEFTIEPELIGNKIYLNPFLIKFFETNPFKLQERTYPIDFGYKDVYTYVMNINLGENIKIIEIPDKVQLSLPENTGNLLFNAELRDNQLNLYFKVKFNEAIYEPVFYDYLKKFMDKIVDLQKNTVIVLEKQ